MERIYYIDFDIVSTSREILEKFIRELHELTTHVKILGSVKNYANPDEITISTSNLSDGIPPEELHLYGDLMTAATAGRALGTRDGGLTILAHFKLL